MHVALTIFFAMSAGCGSSNSVTRGIQEPPRMIEVILGKTPVGTSLPDDERFMQSEGFKCSQPTNGEFLGRRSLDYLYCDRSDGEIVQRRWQVAIVHREGKVSEVLASTGLVGP